MLTILVLMTVVLAAEEPAAAPPTTPAAAAPGKAPAAGVTLPADETGAKAVLEASPRHGEWADVPGPGGAPVRVWTVYPERKDKAPVVIVLMEVFGLTDWIRAVADRLAAEGFIAVAPDMLSG